MRIFHRNKDGRSKDQNNDEFHFISRAMKTHVNRIFYGCMKFHYGSHVTPANSL